MGFLFLMLLMFGLNACGPEPAATQTVIPESTHSSSSTSEGDPQLSKPEPAQTGNSITDQSTGIATPPVTGAEPNRQWQALDVTGGGAQKGLAVHPVNSDIVYVVADNSGIFKTENRGDTWISVSANLGAYDLSSVSLDPLNPDVIYVAAQTDNGRLTEGGATGEIHRSLNGGQSWEFVTDEMGFQTIPSQAAIVIPYDPIDPTRFDQDGDGLSDVILAGGWTGPADPPVGGIWRSTDEGQSFTRLILKDRNVIALRAFPGDANLLTFVTFEGDVYRSEDLGDNWVDITGNLPLSTLSDLAIHPTDKNIVYVTCRWCRPDEAPVWKTTDGGKNWQPLTNGLDLERTEGYPNILIDRFDPNTLFLTTHKSAGNGVGVYKSANGGELWQPMAAELILPDGRPYHRFGFGGRFFAIAQAVDGRLFTADGSGVWRYPDTDSSDGSDVWEPITLGVGNVHVNSIKADPLTPTVLYQGLSDVGPYKSVDWGSTFHRILGNGWPVTVDNYLASDKPYYDTYQYCWLRCASTCQSQGEISAGGTTDFAISNQDSRIVYSAFGSGGGKSKHGGVNKSVDGGERWQPVGFQLEDGFALNPETCVPYGFRHLAINPIDDEVLFAAQEIPVGEMGELYKTVNGGITWSMVYTTAGFIESLEVSTLDPNLVVVATRNNVYKSEQNGAPDSWQDITPPDVPGKVRTVQLSPHEVEVLVVGTNSQGLYYSDDGGSNWNHYLLEGLFEQKLSQNSQQYLAPNIATALNPQAWIRQSIMAIAFDPVTPDTFYVGGTQVGRASIGVAKVTNQGRSWERLPLAGLSHRNIFDLEVDSPGEFLYAGTFNGTYRFKLR